jgi:hypothetical protein
MSEPSRRPTLTDADQLPSQPDMPPEILGVVSEFLAGQHSFGSLASLNVASRAIHEETLSVLYETLLLDKPGFTLDMVRLGDKGKGLLHTK